MIYLFLRKMLFVFVKKSSIFNSKSGACRNSPMLALDYKK